MPEQEPRSSSIYGTTAEPCSVILFGASGDLAKRKVIPAMYDLAQHNSLGERYAIIGFARTPMTDESFRTTIGEAAKTISEVGPIDAAKWNEFSSNLYYSPGGCRKLTRKRISAGTGCSIFRRRRKSTRTLWSSWVARDLQGPQIQIPGCASLLRSRSGATWHRPEN
jgi:glucose-6-phosphate 1-dehydrogenase